MLLALVYGVFLVIIAGMAIALAVLVTAHFSASIVGTTVGHDRALVRLWADANVSVEDVSGRAMEAPRRERLERQLATLVDRGGILHLQLTSVDGTVVVSDRPGLQGHTGSSSEEFSAAAAGTPAARLLAAGEEFDSNIGLPDFPMIREYLPLVTSAGEVAGVVALWRDATPVVHQLEVTRNDVLLVVTVGSAALAVVLLFVFRTAHRRLRRQSVALVESTRRDPLTGLLNHGAVVAALAERIDLANRAGAQLAIAVIDIDNFRLLNETHGHSAGDLALLEVSGQLGSLTPTGTLIGRYGPDEFMVIGPPMAVEVVEQVVDGLRGVLREAKLQLEASEDLPVTISAGIATFPDAAKGITDLLVAAAYAATEAKASGGDAVCRAGVNGEQPAHPGSFSTLQGLIFAVDTKDRYTKRHSEDVARYAVFLGRQLGLSTNELETLRVAGLLHDVGKVGIPDSVLRKPGALSSEERLIVQQHVQLGHLIVRDLPDLDEVRAGVRHHHERWDGTGYLDELAGEDIPLVARILAVGDTFSAMTTTRPYRKAMSVGEALKRLGDAAGTQLDERLVVEFIRAMETAPDVPLPAEEASRPRLWTPRGAAA